MTKVPEEKVQQAKQTEREKLEEQQAEQQAQAELQQEEQKQAEEDRLQRIEEAPKSGVEAQEKLDQEVQDSDGLLGGDSGVQAGSGVTRPEQDADSRSGDKLSDGPPATSTR